jgi:hypothetical protein
MSEDEAKPAEELSGGDLDQVSGGLLPAVRPAQTSGGPHVSPGDGVSHKPFSVQWGDPQVGPQK